MMTVLETTGGTGDGAVLSSSQARELTDKIRVMLEGAALLVIEAYRGRVWLGLGYGSWDEYCRREFGSLSLRPPLEERQQTVMSLREAGLSIRAISAATQLGKGTVERELAAPGVPGGTPERIIGADGKEYGASRHSPAPPADDSEGDGDGGEALDDLLDMSPDDFGIEALVPMPLARRTATPRREAARQLIEHPLPQVIQLSGQLLVPGGLPAIDDDDREVLIALSTLASRGIRSLTSVLGTIDARVLSSGEDAGAALASTVQDAMDELGKVLDALHATK